MTVPCLYCGRKLDPTSPNIYRRIIGWEKKSADPTRRSGSDITLRERLDVFACNFCVDRQKAGVAVGQVGLALVDDPDYGELVDHAAWLGYARVA